MQILHQLILGTWAPIDFGIHRSPGTNPQRIPRADAMYALHSLWRRRKENMYIGIRLRNGTLSLLPTLYWPEASHMPNLTTGGWVLRNVCFLFVQGEKTRLVDIQSIFAIHSGTTYHLLQPQIPTRNQQTPKHSVHSLFLLSYPILAIPNSN